jgi:hypothetical protein
VFTTRRHPRPKQTLIRRALTYSLGCRHSRRVGRDTTAQHDPHNPRQLVGQGDDRSVLWTRCSRARSQPPNGVALAASAGKAERAPRIRSLRKYLLPRLLIPSGRGYRRQG